MSLFHHFLRYLRTSPNYVQRSLFLFVLGFNASLTLFQSYCNGQRSLISQNTLKRCVAVAFIFSIYLKPVLYLHWTQFQGTWLRWKTHIQTREPLKQPSDQGLRYLHMFPFRGNVHQRVNDVLDCTCIANLIVHRISTTTLIKTFRLFH